MTINRQNKNTKRWKLSYGYLTVLLICLLSITVVYAKEIKEFIQNWSTSITLKDGTKINISEKNNFKDISQNAIIVKNNEDSLKMNYQEIEKMLGFSLLKLSENNPEEIYYRTELNNDGTIGMINLWIPYFTKESKEKNISLSIDILNKNADDGYILAFQEGIDATGEKNLEKSYTSKNLNTNIIIYSNDWSLKRLTATFVYDNILYTFIGNNTSQDEMISVIENLK